MEVKTPFWRAHGDFYVWLFWSRREADNINSKQ